MKSNVASDGVRILGERKFSGENLLGARASRARKSPRTRTPSVASFRSIVWRYWKKNGRHKLPWRKTRDPYKILVSEVMLQQTQVDRVIPYYRKFLKMFPTVGELAEASLIDVLRVWSGLGYNRRAKYLHDAAKQIDEKYGGKVPSDYRELIELPGIGDYTARATRVFAFNESDVLIETNIRTAFLYHFFTYSSQSRGRERSAIVSDAEILGIVRKAFQNLDQKKWHWALMDYGAHLKRNGVRLNHRSAHYVKQSKFESSLRQVRGAIMHAVAYRESLDPVRRKFAGKFQRAFKSLIRDGLVSDADGRILNYG